MGHVDIAETVLYKGKERERHNLWKTGRFVTWMRRSCLSAVVGYGIGGRTFRVFYWVLISTVLGACLLSRVPQSEGPPSSTTDQFELIDGKRCLPLRLGAPLTEIIWSNVAVNRLAFSLDILLPIIELDECHDLTRIESKWRYYYYAQAIFGFVLATFLAAALGGITRK